MYIYMCVYIYILIMFIKIGPEMLGNLPATGLQGAAAPAAPVAAPKPVPTTPITLETLQVGSGQNEDSTLWLCQNRFGKWLEIVGLSH